jgi:hypothetical protein
MRSMLNSNLVSIALLGVFLLLASAVGRVAAGNMSTWLTGSLGHAGRAMAADRAEVAAVSPWHAR